MKISIDTKEDSHEDIKKVIMMLQNLVGNSQEVFTNQPFSDSSAGTTGSLFGNIFGDSNAASQEASASAETQASPETAQEAQAEQTDQSTEDLFAELFSEDELKKMDASPKDEDEEPEIKPKSKKPGIEFY